MAADHRILIEAVIVVMADPGIDDLDRLEGGNPRRKAGPDPLLEPGVIDLPVEHLRFFLLLGRQSADKMLALGTKIDARGIDGEGRAVERLGRLLAIEHIDIAFTRADR